MSSNMPAIHMGTTTESVQMIRSVWVFSHECAGIAQAGGLGEAVAGLANSLGSDYKLNVTVFLPSHGRHLDPVVRESYDFVEDATFIAKGLRTGANRVLYPFLSGIEMGRRLGVNYILVRGLDAQTSKWLDDPRLYDHDLTFEKMALFSRTVRLYSEYLLSMHRSSELPDLIHANDWHMVPAGVAVKQHLDQRGVTVPLVFTIHLLSHITLPWHYASDDWSGISDIPQSVRLANNKLANLTAREVWEKQCNNSIERFGCYEADYVTSVSESYLAQDVMQYVGNVITGRSGHVYNGCDWDPNAIRAGVFRETGLSGDSDHQVTVERWDLRKSLLTKEIGSVNQRRLETNMRAGSTVNNLPESVEPFPEDGPLVLMTGRMSLQKGADLLLDAVPSVAKAIPETRFVLFLLPSGDLAQMDAIEKRASGYSDNVRIIFAKHPQTYLMCHVAADVYAMPSRSEPFGISALEAMVTGNPVVGSNVGGIRETVLDIVGNGDLGTGVLFPAENIRALADSLISLLRVMQIDERMRRHGDDPLSLVRKIPIRVIAELVARNPTLGSKIRENCVSRVEQNFRWKNAGQMALSRYDAAKKQVGFSQ